MQRLCRITVPGLSIKSEFPLARERLLSEFPNIHEVVATTAPGTVLVVYSGAHEAGAWYALLDSIATSEVRITRRFPRWRGAGSGGGESAA
jgi:hypothetical protein